MIYLGFWLACWIYLMIRGFRDGIYSFKNLDWFDVICIILDLILGPIALIFVLSGDYKSRR